jgi:asparagine N-glycosylation enzyme membrane subunit Stt3
MKKVSYLICGLAALVTIVIGIDSMEPYSLTAIGFMAWAISPYGLLSILIKFSKSQITIPGTLILAVAASVFGLGLIIDALYIHLDAQGGLVYIIVPFWQWVTFLLCLVPFFLLNRENNA